MKTASNIIAIQNGAVLLVCKKSIWILPGGKHEPGESDEECLARELSEELPNASVCIGPKLGIFDGTTPHTKQPIITTVFHGSIDGDCSPGAEIERSAWFTKAELERANVSELTRKILNLISFQENIPRTVMDYLGEPEDRAIWTFCGAFPLEEIAKGQRACRYTWRGVENDDRTGWAMFSVYSDEDESDPKIWIEREYEDEKMPGLPFQSISDMRALDWYLENAK